LYYCCFGQRYGHSENPSFCTENGRSEAEEKNTGIRKRIFQEGQIYRAVHGIRKRVQTTVFC
jgi:hypothetical protein